MAGCTSSANLVAFGKFMEAGGRWRDYMDSRSESWMKSFWTRNILTSPLKSKPLPILHLKCDRTLTLGAFVGGFNDNGGAADANNASSRFISPRLRAQRRYDGYYTFKRAIAWLSKNSHPNVRHFIQCFIQIKLSFIRNEAGSRHHRRRLTNLQQDCHYEGTQAGHKAIFEAPNLCLKLYYTEINIWQNQRILHTDLTFTLGLAQRCTVTAEQSWGRKVIQAFVGSYLI